MRGHAGPSRRLARLAGVALLVVVMAGCWPAVGQGPDRRSHNPFESGITAANVATLTPVWTTPATGDAARSPIVGDTTVHVVIGGRLVTFDKATGESLWRYPDGDYSPSFAAAVADGDRVLLTLGSLVGEAGTFDGESAWFDARTGTRPTAGRASRPR